MRAQVDQTATAAADNAVVRGDATAVGAAGATASDSGREALPESEEPHEAEASTAEAEAGCAALFEPQVEVAVCVCLLWL